MANDREVTISISGVPKDLLAKLDKLAAREHRHRSRQIVKMLDDILRDREQAHEEHGKAA